jgi:hypothetical protein
VSPKFQVNLVNIVLANPKVELLIGIDCKEKQVSFIVNNAVGLP